MQGIIRSGLGVPQIAAGRAEAHRLPVGACQAGNRRRSHRAGRCHVVDVRAVGGEHLAPGRTGPFHQRADRGADPRGMADMAAAHPAKAALGPPVVEDQRLVLLHRGDAALEVEAAHRGRDLAGQHDRHRERARVGAAQQHQGGPITSRREERFMLYFPNDSHTRTRFCRRLDRRRESHFTRRACDPLHDQLDRAAGRGALLAERVAMRDILALPRRILLRSSSHGSSKRTGPSRASHPGQEVAGAALGRIELRKPGAELVRVLEHPGSRLIAFAGDLDRVYRRGLEHMANRGNDFMVRLIACQRQIGGLLRARVERKNPWIS